MKNIKKLLLGATLFSLALTGCSGNKAPFAGKKYSYTSITEVSVDEGFYDSNEGFNGKDKDGFASLFAPRVGNPFEISDTLVGGLKYGGNDIKVYGVSYQREGFDVMGAYLGPTETENVYKFYTNRVGFDYEIEAYACQMGHYIHTKTIHGETITETRTSIASVSQVSYNKDEDSLTFSVGVVDTYTLDDESTVKNASFTLTWKRA